MVMVSMMAVMMVMMVVMMLVAVMMASMTVVLMMACGAHVNKRHDLDGREEVGRGTVDRKSGVGKVGWLCSKIRVLCSYSEE